MLERLNEAMAYVERHLDERIDVTELARIALTSEYHFRRMFSALAGMPLSEYVRRRRLTIAAAEGGGRRTDPARHRGPARVRLDRGVHPGVPGDARGRAR